METMTAKLILEDKVRGGDRVVIDAENGELTARVKCEEKF